MDERIVWDGTNPSQVVLFVEKHGRLGDISMFTERGVELTTPAGVLPVTVGDAIVVRDGGLSVERAHD